MSQPTWKYLTKKFSGQLLRYTSYSFYIAKSEHLIVLFRFDDENDAVRKANDTMNRLAGKTKSLLRAISFV